tara:strand:- start:1077 stop:2102 length:1026 start_codon:yes stop_codon:yes gene_type:complete
MNLEIWDIPENEQLWNQLKGNLDISEKINTIKYDTLLVMGMGGSGIAGDVLKLISNSVSKKEILVRKTYSIPEQILSRKPFCLFISYSGNTEETISGLDDAISNQLDWAVISSGGKLLEQAEIHDKAFIKVPKGLQPRNAFGYLTQAVMKILDVNEGTKYMEQLEEAGGYISDLFFLDPLEPDYREKDLVTLAYSIAQKLKKKTAIIYGGTPMTQLVASRWKTQINENSKSRAFTGDMPEVHHNEILSWNADPRGSKKYILIFLRDKNEHPQIAKRFDYTEEVLKDKVSVVNIFSKEKETIKSLMELVLLGDLVSLCLAEYLNVDPQNIDTIEEIKKLLKG